MNKNSPKYIIIHTTDISYGAVKNQLDSVNNYHRDVTKSPKSSLGYYVGYHCLITDGKNYRTKLDTDEGAHCNQTMDGISMNLQSLGVAIGFDGDIEYPAPEDYILLKEQVIKWQDQYNIPDDYVTFHRNFTPWKTCPGSLLGEEWKKNLLAREPSIKPISEVEKAKLIKEISEKISLIQKLIVLIQRLRDLLILQKK